MDDKKKLDKYIEDYFKDEDKFSPTSATALGIHQYDSEMEDFSLDSLGEMRKSYLSFKERLHKINFDLLDEDRKIKFHLMNERLKASRRFFENLKPYERDPAFYSEVAIQSVFLLLLREFAPLEERLSSASKRMKKFPKFFSAAKKNIKNPPKVFVNIALEMIQGGMAFLSQLVPQMAREVPKIKDEVLGARDFAYASLKDYENFIIKEVVPKSKGDYAIGKDLLNEILKESEFLDYSCDELWEIAQEELIKCEKEVIDFVKREYKTDKPWREVFKETKKNHPLREELLSKYKESLNKARQFVIEKDLVTIPEGQKLICMETPEFQRATTPHAAMMPAAPFEDDKTGFLMVAPIDLSQSNEDQERQLMESSYGKLQYLALHEAYPGHHLQLVYASRVKDHLYRRTFSNIFIEGWAFYCEQMMKEMGYFDRDGELAQLEAAYWRALRILLDIGLHTKRFTFDEALEFLRSKVDWAPYIARGELKRYTRMPTQALSYYTGKLEIFRIKESYKKAKGSSFVLKEFHEDLLRWGSLPPKLIEWRMGIREIEKPKLI